MAKLLGLDVGEKRIGYALADDSLGMAFPRTFLVRSPRDEDVFLLIEKICAEERISKIIVGEPLGEENEQTKRSTKIHAFIAKLLARLPKIIECHFVDESFSSKEALSRIPLKRDRKQKGSDDAIAAQIILERYLVAEGGFEPPTSRL